EDAELLGRLVNALNACYARDESIALLRHYVENHLQEDNGLPFDLLDLLLAKGELEEIEQLARQYDASGQEHM
ncbi:hypothetical protein PT80_23060, partial [Salmonella enterica subsp. enterica serovar Schwarzengrund]